MGERKGKGWEKKTRKGTVSWFCIWNQLLYLCFQNKTDHGKIQQQLVVPKSYKTTVERLKSCMAHTPISRLPNLNEPFILTTDASNISLGAVWLQNTLIWLSRCIRKQNIIAQRNTVFNNITRVPSLSVGYEEGSKFTTILLQNSNYKGFSKYWDRLYE